MLLGNLSLSTIASPEKTLSNSFALSDISNFYDTTQRQKHDRSIVSSYDSSVSRSTAMTTSRKTLTSDFLPDIFQYCLMHQTINRPNNYLTRHHQAITDEMRAILVDWLIEVSFSQNFETIKRSPVKLRALSPNTLPMAVNYIDRFLSSFYICKTKFQLIGITALFVAVKMNHEHLPTVEDLCELTDCTYDEFELQRTERILLNSLDFKLLPIIPTYFYQYFLSISGGSEDSYSPLFCQFLTELCLLDYNISIDFLPSEVALSIVLLLRINIKYHVSQLTLLQNISHRLLRSIKNDGVLCESLLNYLIENPKRILRLTLGMTRLWRGLVFGKRLEALLSKYCGRGTLTVFPGFDELCKHVPDDKEILKHLQLKYEI